MTDPRLLPAGDAALSVEFGDAIDPALNARVHALDRALAADPPPGLIETVPTYRSLLVYFDPLTTDAAALGPILLARAGTAVIGQAAGEGCSASPSATAEPWARICRASPNA